MLFAARVLGFGKSVPWWFSVRKKRGENSQLSILLRYRGVKISETKHIKKKKIRVAFYFLKVHMG